AFAGQNRADLQTLNADTLQLPSDLLVDELVRFNNLLLLVDRVGNGFAADATDDSLAKIDDFLVTLVNRANDDAVDRAAIFHVDDDVLCGVNQLTGKVTRVGSFERGIGQTFAGALGRDEILEHPQAFAEVGRNRALDNFAARFRHQTAHAGEL